ncbi:hypothetical protein DEH69_18230 [Streptomyces sp. PT12]|nr:hypothetical protein DEH69_18230 [Streptomyces sp. PT12]
MPTLPGLDRLVPLLRERARQVGRARVVAAALARWRAGAPRAGAACRRHAGRALATVSRGRLTWKERPPAVDLTKATDRPTDRTKTPPPEPSGPPGPPPRPPARTRQQRLSAASRRLEVAAAGGAIALGLLAALLWPDAGGGMREARASSSIAEGVSRPGAVDAPAAAPDAGSTADLDPSISGEPSAVVAPPLTRADPVRVHIPQLSTDVEVFGADLSPDGGPPSPSEEDAQRAAWYSGGVSPGERGAAILVGHLDTYDGPAAFAGLGSLRPGENIEIDRADGQIAVFTVDSVEQYPKSDFPDERVYGSVDSPQLRLITCGGRWSEGGGYDSNIVAYARLTASTISASSHVPAGEAGMNGA